MEKQKNIPQLRFPEFDSEWDKKRLGDLGVFSGGGTPDTTELKFWNGNIPWISSSDIMEDSIQEIRVSRFITEEAVKKSATKIIPVNSVLMVSRVGIGKFAVSKQPLCASQDFTNLLPKNDNAFFLGYYFKLKTNRFLRFSQGTSIKGFTGADIRNMDFQIPSLPEQQKIASFFTAIDKKISQLKQKKTLLEQYKKGVMQKIFSQEIRFKDDNGKEFPEWEKKKVKDIFRVTRGQVLATSKVKPTINDDYKYPVYSSQTKLNGLMGYFNEYLFEDCITWTTDGANAGDVNFRKGRFYCTNVCGVLVGEIGYANLCIAEILNLVSRKHVSYVGNPKLMNNVMAEIKITVPESISEQLMISKFLSSIDIKINHTQTQIEKAEVWKKGLLQKMFV